MSHTTMRFTLADKHRIAKIRAHFNLSSDSAAVKMALFALCKEMEGADTSSKEVTLLLPRPAQPVQQPASISDFFEQEGF